VVHPLADHLPPTAPNAPDRVEPRETLDYVFKEISSLWQVYTQCPIFGVQYDADNVRRDATAAQQAAAAKACVCDCATGELAIESICSSSVDDPTQSAL